MGKIVLLVPRQEMLHLAHNILQEKQYHISDRKVIATDQAVTEARNAIGQGAQILIARGLQAALIKQYTEIPVVEIVVSAQEMALLIVKAKQILKKERPCIAVIGVADMFCDMTFFEQIYEIELRTYFAGSQEELLLKAKEAVQDGADLMIGGDTVVAEAKGAGIPSLFLSTTEDSMRSAFAKAETWDAALESEKKSVAQIETILDSSFNGVVNVDAQGRVGALNPVMEGLLGRPGEDLVGQPVSVLLPDLEMERLRAVLAGEEESASCFMQLDHTPIYTILAPVRVGSDTVGAVLTCHKVKKQSKSKEAINQTGDTRTVRGNFAMLWQRSKVMQDCIHLARLYSQSDHPVLILGETGTEKRRIAECIHNAGLRSDQSFAAVSVSGLSEEMQRSILFGEKGAASMLNGGTLLLEDIEALTKANQHSLEQLICYGIGNSRDYTGQLPLNVRLIVTSQLEEEQIRMRVAAGDLKESLYYVLQGLVLWVPPLRLRREDLEDLIQAEVKQLCEQYSRYHILTKGASKCLLNYPWPGNAIQLDSYLKRLILTAEKRSLDEITVRNLLDKLYSADSAKLTNLAEHDFLPGSEKRVRCEEEERIREALYQYSGSREKTAAELGISTATLWRKIKKYRIV